MSPPSHLVTALTCAGLLLLSAPAWACRGDCECGHSSGQSEGAVETKAAVKKGDELAATCNCQGPSECTCKKGQCRCKKCPKHHGESGPKKI